VRGLFSSFFLTDYQIFLSCSAVSYYELNILFKINLPTKIFDYNIKAGIQNLTKICSNSLYNKIFSWYVSVTIIPRIGISGMQTLC